MSCSEDRDGPIPDAVLPQPRGMHARELLTRAEEYLKAARAVGEAHPNRLIHPTYYLLAHSVELGLKSFLSAKGHSKKALRKVGHDLPELVTLATDEELPEIEHFDVLIGHLWRINKDFSLRYPVGYIHAVLKFDQAANIAKTLLAATNQAVTPVYFEDWLRFIGKYRDKYVVWSD